MSDKYQQVACSFYDQITDVIVKKQSVRIDYKNSFGEFIQTTAIPRDIVTENAQEFLTCLLYTSPSPRDA